MNVRVGGQLTFNNSYAMIDAAVSGYGIAYIPEDTVAAQIADGRLVLSCFVRVEEDTTVRKRR